MPKATISEITQAGFRAEQFGAPADWSTADTGYLAVLLNRAGRWAANRIGASVYDSVVADTDVNDSLIRAETFYSIAELWRRRAAFIDSNANISMQDGAYLERREFLLHADSAMAVAERAIADAQSTLGVSVYYPGSGLSMGHVEHGSFPVAV